MIPRPGDVIRASYHPPNSRGVVVHVSQQYGKLYFTYIPEGGKKSDLRYLNEYVMEGDRCMCAWWTKLEERAEILIIERGYYEEQLDLFGD